jgi:hypothetical protein
MGDRARAFGAGFGPDRNNERATGRNDTGRGNQRPRDEN